MADDPFGSLIGTSLVGAGVMMLYGAYKNKRLFGEDGIISQALSRGSITSLDKVPSSVPGGALASANSPAGARASATRPVRAAVEEISDVDVSLGAQIEVQTFLVREGMTRAELDSLAALLAIADGKGLSASTSVIRGYVRSVTGVSI